MSNNQNPPEAVVTINGVPLTLGQSMTLRVAINHFISDMQHNGLGDDETGKSMAKSYIDRAREIQTFVHLNLN